MINGMYVGVDKEAVDAVQEAILTILQANADQKSIRFALRQLTKCVQPKDFVIRDCEVNMTVNSADGECAGKCERG